jgi:hypothetical protein
MSYDIQVWSVRPFEVHALRKPELWQQESASWVHAGKNWQIVISASDRVQPEDIPEEITKLLPGIEWLTNLNLEGKASGEAFRLEQSAGDGIARHSHGAVLDQQDGSIRLPSGVKRFLSPKTKEAFDVLSMSWWLLGNPIETREGREGFVELLERLLPECLPKRCGLYEPPQHVYDQTGKQHCLAFWQENAYDMIVWYPHRPVVSVHFALPNPVGAHKLGFRANHAGIEIEKNALQQPGWATALKRFWRDASIFLRPIYGDVRVLHGYEWMGATVSGGQQHPVKSWWWAGIPETLGTEVVLGEMYQKLWPEFMVSSTMADRLAFAAQEDWATDKDLATTVGRPPQAQMQIPDRSSGVLNAEDFRKYMEEVRRVGAQNARRKYPEGWPFGEQFADNG